jgi:hypothetical protein
MMHVVGARWSGRMAALAEAFSAFFPISFVLFLGLFIGKSYVFPWLEMDLHGKESWLNLPFLFARDGAGLLILYGIGAAFLYYSLQLRLGQSPAPGSLRQRLQWRWQLRKMPPEKIRSRMTVLGLLYCLSFALVLSLIGYDLVMALDPHWISTLFGAYSFIKPVYIGLGGLIILAALVRLKHGNAAGLEPSHFHDVGKLFFGFCLVWADFFYAQLVVIWYGNIAEETHYVIQRTMMQPWKTIAWLVLIVGFAGPFLILLNQRIKTIPRAMIVLCSIVIAAIWMEHFLLVAPAMSGHGAALPIGLTDVCVTLGFLALMAFALSSFFKVFPETVTAAGRDDHS